MKKKKHFSLTTAACLTSLYFFSAGITRVVSGIVDPDPRVSGNEALYIFHIELTHYDFSTRGWFGVFEAARS